MNQTIAIIGLAVAVLVIFSVLIWVNFSLRKLANQLERMNNRKDKVEEDIDHLFSEELREELTNKARSQFDKVMKENSLFIEQDLRLTAAQVNEEMKSSINKVLKEQFSNYVEAVETAKDAAIKSISSTQDAIESKRQEVEAQLQNDMRIEKDRLTNALNSHLSEVLNQYILTALGESADLGAQTDYVIKQLKANKDKIKQDIDSAV